MTTGDLEARLIDLETRAAFPVAEPDVLHHGVESLDRHALFPMPPRLLLYRGEILLVACHTCRVEPRFTAEQPPTA